MLKTITNKRNFNSSMQLLKYRKHVDKDYFVAKQCAIYRYYSSEVMEPSSNVLQNIKRTGSSLQTKPTRRSTEAFDDENAIVQQANSARSIEEIYVLIQKNVNNLSGQECVAVLNSLYLILQDIEEDVNVEDIRNRKELIELCCALKRHIRMITLVDVILALRALMFLQIPTSSFICQSLLQLIAKFANELTAGQVVYLNALLKNAESCPLIDALKIAFPIIFNARVKTGLNSRSVNSLLRCFQYGVESADVEPEVLDAIVNKLTNEKIKLSAQNCADVMKTFLSRNALEDQHLELYDYCLEKIIKNIDRLSFDDISLILRRMAAQVVNGVGDYNEYFLDEVVRYVIQNELSFESAAQLLEWLNTMDFVSLELLDYMDSRFLSYDNFSEIQSAKLLTIYLTGLSTASYKPRHLNMYIDKLAETIEQNKYYGNYSIVKAAYDLICLDYWSDKLLEFVFADDFGKLIANDSEWMQKRAFINLYQAVVTLYPGGYKGELPPFSLIKSFIDETINVDASIEIPLLPALQYCFGGSQYIISRVFTKMGHFLDHLVVLQNDCPISITDTADESQINSGINIDDLKVPEESKLISILTFDDSYTCNNTTKLTGHAVVRIRSIESLGIISIPIILSEWNALPESERLPFLTNKLNFAGKSDNTKTEDMKFEETDNIFIK